MYARHGDDVGTRAHRPFLPSPIAAALDEGVKCAFGGEVVVRSGESKGKVYLYEGRVAWVTCDTISARLGDALRAYVEIPDDELREAVNEGRRSGKGFGEVLIDWKLVDQSTLRRALLEHNAAHFRGILGFSDPLQAMFIPQPRTYSSGLLFTVEELLRATGQASVSKLQPPSGELRSALKDVPEATIAFVLGEASEQFEGTARNPEAVRALCSRVFGGRSAPLANAAPSEVILLDREELIVLRRSGGITAGMVCEGVRARSRGLTLSKARGALERLF
ncbi:MAG: hypothetical protein AAFU77_15330 [Myxococcota bacterium]